MGKDAKKTEQATNRFARGETAVPDGNARRRATDFEAERLRRLLEAEVQKKIGEKSCRSCTVKGAWRRYDDDRKKGAPEGPTLRKMVRIRCIACGFTDKVIAEIRSVEP
jgi:hypothetical protein